MSSSESGHLTRLFIPTANQGTACPTNENNLRCVDYNIPTESETLAQISEWKWKKYNKCSVSDSGQSLHTACGTNGYCCRNTENFCPVGALEPIRNFDDNSAVSFTELRLYYSLYVRVVVPKILAGNMPLMVSPI